MSAQLGTLLSSLLSNSATSTAAVNIFNALGSQLTTNHQSSSSVAALLEQMQANPGNAGTLAALIATQNPPSGVQAYISEAVSFAADAAAPNASAAARAPFINAIVQAKAALQASGSQGTLGALLTALGGSGS
jgi:hypothetical protein